MPSERNYRLLAEDLKKAGSLRFGGVVGSFGTYLAARFLEVFAPRQVLTISPDPERALVFQDNLKFFSTQLSLDCRFEFFPGSGALEGMVSRLVRLEEGERLRILSGLAFPHFPESGRKIISASVTAAFTPLPSPLEMKKRALWLRKGEIKNRDELLNELVALGYRRLARAEEVGEFSARGGIVDFFCPNYPNPVRLEFDADRIDSLRFYEPVAQRSIGKVNEVVIIPVDLNPDRSSPVFLSDYLAPGALVIIDRAEAVEREGERQSQPLNRIVKEHYRFDLAELPLRNSGDGRVNLEVEANEELWKLRALPKRQVASSFALLAEEIRELKLKGLRVSLVAPEEARAERLKTLLEPYQVRFPRREGQGRRNIFEVKILIGDLHQGFRDYADQVAYLTEEDIFGPKIRRKSAYRALPGEKIGDFYELKEGDYLVHLDYGIGIFRGLKKVRVEGSARDFLLLQYLGGDLLYLPVDRMNLLRRYWSQEGSIPVLDRLGGREWERRKRKVSESVRELAQELIKIYASRQVKEGVAFPPPDQFLREFEGSFSYAETEDQSRAIAEVLEDLQKSKPMDRLVCGDVGFGKTEVAIRAAFKVATEGKQVALLCPTTVLVEQHFKTLKSRMSNYPVRIEALSRFRSRMEQKAILRGLQEGQVDILIGTHRLLSKDVEFKDLGLLIIDEEHRFGVAQKEKIKSYRALVDVLTLTATPIPRTLQLALSGIRDLSLISTPPPERHAVHNYLIYFNPEEIKTAIQEELSRGGQVFFVHNRVRSIGGIRQFLEKILPGVPVGVAHGQMNAKELEEVMIKFLNREINILLCTAIIGSGLDIPSANTILINRADRFGLADLYQLRGRVGRGKEMAYCYFIIPKESPFSAGAVERLRAIKTLADLGSGYRLAVNDLEIRGAGEIFGPHQSGHIEAVGYDLYLEMLEREIKQLKAGEELPPLEPEIRVSPPAFIPEDYLEFPEERLEFYRRLSLARDDEELQGLELELQDRFGELPGEVANLFLTLALKLRLRTLRVKRMEEDTRNLFLWFDDSTPVSPEILFELVQSSGKKARLTPEGKLTYPLRSEKAPEQLGEIKGILDGIISKIKMKKD